MALGFSDSSLLSWSVVAGVALALVAGTLAGLVITRLLDRRSR